MSGMIERLELMLRVHPGAREGSVVGRYGDRIKIRIAEPAVDGKANRALIRFLAREFGVKESRVTLASGASGRDKRVVIEGPATLPAWLPDGAGGQKPSSRCPVDR